VKSVKLTIDDQVLEVSEDTTVLEAARNAGKYVPTLCHHPKLGPLAACRVCCVEIEGQRGLAASCTTQVQEGMVIQTASERVRKAQKNVIQLMLADGDHDCITCEECGHCELQDVVYRLGIERPSYTLPAHDLPIDDSHPMLLHDPSKCIQCFRCVVGCQDSVVNDVLEMGYRGFQSRIIVDQLKTFAESSCVSCGECIQLCPTGALTEKKSMGSGRPWDLETVQTTCPYCGVGCQMDLHIDKKQNRVVKVTGTECVPNQGMLCVKGRFAYDFPADSKRLTQPLIRKNGSLQPVSWEEALDYTANRLGEIKAEHGADSICAVGSARDTNENNYSMMKFTRAVIGTNNLDHCART